MILGEGSGQCGLGMVFMIVRSLAAHGGCTLITGSHYGSSRARVVNPMLEYNQEIANYVVIFYTAIIFNSSLVEGAFGITGKFYFLHIKKTERRLSDFDTHRAGGAGDGVDGSVDGVGV